jgi:Fur family zinc uptake transcriptional regulator
LGFSAETEGLLDRADGMCGARGVRLTPLRREVLGLILDADGPMGAYDLLERLRATRLRAAPPTVYRALDFLLEQGLIHKLARLAAFVGCVAGPASEGHAHDEDHDHAAQFLICRACGKVAEIEDADLSEALAAAASRLGFAVSGATIEAEGLCAGCAPSVAG